MATNNSINNKTGDFVVDPGASGDSFVQYDINGIGEFRLGVDDSDSDKFKLSQGSALGTNDTFVLTSAGEITKPLQPAFLAVLNTTLTNVTGNNVLYTVVWDTEVFDQNGDFDGTSTFTAPITGRYMFNCAITYGDLTGAGYVLFRLNTSNRTYLFPQINITAADSNDEEGRSCSMITEMDSGDTAILQINSSMSTQTVDVVSNGSTDSRNWFSGYLMC